MSGNHSRYSHQPDRRYSQLNMLQGAMVTDADQNEAQAIAQRHVAMSAELAIGSGVPRDDGCLVYSATTGVGGFLSVTGVKPGRVMADGLWGVLRYAEGQSRSNDMDLFTKQADFLNAPAVPSTGRFVAVADLWDMHVGLPLDGRFVDPAFLSEETAVRRERLAQLRLVSVAADPTAGWLSLQTPAGLPATGDFRLTAASPSTTSAAVDLCGTCTTTVSDSSGQSGNHLFRLEIHESTLDEPVIRSGGVDCKTPTSGQSITVKFSNDNGSAEFVGSARMAQALANDPTYATAVFEIYDRASDQRLGLAAHTRMARGAELVSPATLLTKTDTDLRQKNIRVWAGAAVIDLNATGEQSLVGIGSVGMAATVTRASTWEVLLDVSGLSLTLQARPRASGVPFALPGDAWTIDIRENADGTSSLNYRAEPQEVQHHYTLLGVIQNGAFVANTATGDMRSRAFPALTDLTAQDVAWSNRNHPAVPTSTVQGAIDLLFARPVVEPESCLCTFCLSPEHPLEDQFEEIIKTLHDEIRAGRGGTSGGALICFPKGRYQLSKPVTLKELGAVILCGAGMDVSEILFRDGAFFDFDACSSATLRDMTLTGEGAIEDGLVRSSGGDLRLEKVRLAATDVVNNDYRPLVQHRGKEGDPLGKATFLDCYFILLQGRIGLECSDVARLEVADCLFAGPAPVTSERWIIKPSDVLAKAVIRDYVVLQPIIAAPSDGKARIGSSRVMLVLLGQLAQYAEALADLVAEVMDALGIDPPDASAISPEWGAALTPVAAAIKQAELAREMAWDARYKGSANTRTARKPTANLMRYDLPGKGEIEIAHLDLLRIELALDGFLARPFSVSAAINFGIRANLAPLGSANVVNNRFEWVQTPIILQGEEADTKLGWQIAAGRVEVANNMIRRAALQSAAGSTVQKKAYPAAINIDSPGYLYLSGNTIAQDVSSREHADAFLAFLGDTACTSKSYAFSAIALTGQLGPVAHISANDAVYFRHCVTISAEARWQTYPSNTATRRQQLWTLRDNTVLPVLMEGNYDAVRLSNAAASVQTDGFVRLGNAMDDYNHPDQDKGGLK